MNSTSVILSLVTVRHATQVYVYCCCCCCYNILCEVQVFFFAFLLFVSLTYHCLCSLRSSTVSVLCLYIDSSVGRYRGTTVRHLQTKYLRAKNRFRDHSPASSLYELCVPVENVRDCPRLRSEVSLIAKVPSRYYRVPWYFFTVLAVAHNRWYRPPLIDSCVAIVI